MKHNITADKLWFLLLFTKSRREKNIEKRFFVSADAEEQWVISANTLSQYLPNPTKIFFRVTCIFT